MASFSEREQAFENKFKHDAELRFKIIMRRNKLVGLWAAGLLGHTGDKAEEYAKSAVESDFEKPGHDDVIAKLMADFQAAKQEMSEHRLLKQMEEMLDEAQRQITAE
ncbi:MAG: DUF1476 domain-containing protein [Oceanibaculum nanhaiense]|uniref:DUF1476 domain-containing protein n=1 Tax=Oceanibaculum nanhaiense TaxID=1909734 RepID=UPI0025A4B561|nr:DUF1476 domain-containing protein [Oceanibaculum nanhaiense]MDM7947408.1 DUF1476 domain-containing protein [Oceanibaculum nanhaiense]